MPFTPEQVKLIEAALNRKLPTRFCPLCRHNTFVLAEDIVIVPVGMAVWTSQSFIGSTQFGGMPCVATTCANCGNTQFYNVHPLGVAAALGQTQEQLEKQGADRG